MLTALLATIVLAFVITQMAILATTVYLHRGLAHRAVRIAAPVALACRFVIWITTGMKPREWAAVHRKHHSATDTADDPHSPIVHGFWRVQLGNAGLYRRAARNELTLHKYGRDLPPDRLDRLFFDRAFLGLGVGITLACLLTTLAGFGPWVGLAASGLHAVSYLMLAGAINAVGHRVGKRPYENSATNLQSVALLTGGEGLHNNHHAAPTSARFSLHRGEFDPGWLIIRALAALKLATVRHDDVKFKRVAA
jgi:stearoyl-CoA desaturase (delta-9 desaturase)